MKPLTLAAAIIATIPTGIFIGVLITGGGINIASSLITLTMWWLSVPIAALYETNPNSIRANKKEN